METGYFVANHANLARSQHLFAQLWKEYALSDSRYLTSDPFMLCVEAITAVLWGPLCFATALSYARQGSRRLRHPLALVTSVAHLYGVALYYATCYVEEAYRGAVYSRPEFLYFWVYYVGFNAPWVLVPIGKQLSIIRCPAGCLSTMAPFLFLFFAPFWSPPLWGGRALALHSTKSRLVC